MLKPPWNNNVVWKYMLVRLGECKKKVLLLIIMTSGSVFKQFFKKSRAIEKDNTTNLCQRRIMDEKITFYLFFGI